MYAYIHPYVVSFWLHKINVDIDIERYYDVRSLAVCALVVRKYSKHSKVKFSQNEKNKTTAKILQNLGLSSAYNVPLTT